MINRLIIDISTIIPAVAFILYVFFVIFGFFQYKKDRFYWSFQLYMVFFSIWSFGSMMMHLNSSIMTPLAWNRVMLIGMLSAPFALTHFIVDILDIQIRSIRLFIKYSYMLILPLMILNFTGSIVSDVGFTSGGDFYYVLASGSIGAYSISYVYVIITLLILLITSKYRPLQKYHRNLLLPLIGVVIMLIGILMNLFPELGKYPIDVFSATINALLLFYTIYKYRLINYSRLGLSIIYSTILAITAAIAYYVIISFFELINGQHDAEYIFQLAIILGIATSIIIHPMRNLITFTVDNIIIPKRHPYQTTIKNLSKKLTTIVNLNELGEEVVKNLSSGMKAEWVVFAVKRIDDDNRFIIQANSKCPTKIAVGDDVVFTFSPDVEKKLERLQQENVSSIINVSPDEQRLQVSEQLPLADVLIPLIFRKQISGYIVLGYDPSKTYPVNSIVEFNNLYYRKVRVGSGDPTNTLIWDEIIVYDSTMIEPQPIPTINHQNTLKTSLGNGLDENIKEVFTQTTLRGKIVDNKTYFKGFFGVKNNTQKDYVMFEPDLSSVDESNIILTYINI